MRTVGILRPIALAAAALTMLMPVRVRADQPEIHVSFSADSILIGDRFFLDVTMTKDMVQVLELPQFQFNGAGGLEMISEAPFDTVSVDGRRHTLMKRYLLTSFQEGGYSIDSFPAIYYDKNIVDTIFAPERLRLFVDTFPIDTVNQTIFDIKAPLDAPVLVSEWGGYLTSSLLLALLVVAAVYLIARRIASHRSGTVIERPKEAPHVVAFRELDRLHGQNFWQNNQHKLYYTRLTDILREYLAGRYGVSAMEMTSDEILEAVSKLPDLSVRDFTLAEQVLRESDLVKFAKMVPPDSRNEEAYSMVYTFVDSTKLCEEQADAEEQPVQEDASPADSQAGEDRSAGEGAGDE